MNRVSQRMLSHILITILGWHCLLLAGSASGLGTPPQKPTQSNAIGSNAVILEADDLRAAPDSNSTMLLRMEKGAQMRLLLSQGAWSQISNAGHTGLVRGFSVRKQGNDGIELSDLAVLVKKPQGKVLAVAWTRGLDEERLSLASNDSAEIELLRCHVISRQEAKQYAQAAELPASDVTYIAAPNQSQFSAQ